ncbi:exosome complex RNA-binding protein Rrp4 [Hyperthermus butylicus]|uniref:Exosome complex component Rrp4 n=1 Tax=Hyperthermus butylicus (strain DSM 5456 / JCM 9403 / PLM1-5) TaxID=415426 RepID=A2BKB9_HYPBU|nr:exosome complex RNA-binding protein Rrp4 [Hyperthermus butylicus]ABM80430.1 putative RNA binding protein Rrp4 [Hyperthermus butylicus DSM 5456]
MARIYVQNRSIVVPGDLLAEGEDVVVESIFVERVGLKYYATITGLANVQQEDGKFKVSIIPLEGAYIPRPGDIVIGLVRDIGLTHWEVDIASPYKGILTVQEVLDRPFNPATDSLKKYLDVGDYIVAKIVAFDRARDPLLTIKGKGLGRIVEGSIVEIKPSRVPRVIGKKGSMVNMIMQETGCEVLVGQNGRILVKCPNRELEEIVVLSIKKIEAEAHTTGLTERVREFIRRERSRRGV